MRLPVLFAMSLAACSSSHSGEDAGDGSPVTLDSSTPGEDSGEGRPDATVGPMDATVTVDATSPSDATTTDPDPPEEWVPLTIEQADCLGLTAPACAGCHSRDGTFYLRPFYGPPPPPGVDRTAPEECGVVLPEA